VLNRILGFEKFKRRERQASEEKESPEVQRIDPEESNVFS